MIRTVFWDFDFFGTFLTRKSLKNGKNLKKGHFWTFEVIKRVKNEKYQKTVRIIFEGPYKDALFKFIDNLNKNWGTSSIFCRKFLSINFAEKLPFFQ